MRIRANTVIARSAEEVFDLTQDYSRRHEWDTLTPDATVSGNAIPTSGTPVHCPTLWGMTLEVTYVNYQRPRLAAFRMHAGPWMLQSVAGCWRFIALGANQCRVEFVYHLRLHPAVSWALTPGVRWLVQRQTWTRLHALKRLAEDSSSPFFGH